ncbi:MAG: hypothetical protein HRU23_03665 [Gammaproteobacteria bacterium]|nr:hypothetical protein [Gammaproteobacteria bacterium]
MRNIATHWLFAALVVAFVIMALFDVLPFPVLAILLLVSWCVLAVVVLIVERWLARQ